MPLSKKTINYYNFLTRKFANILNNNNNDVKKRPIKLIII